MNRIILNRPSACMLPDYAKKTSVGIPARAVVEKVIIPMIRNMARRYLLRKEADCLYDCQKKRGKEFRTCIWECQKSALVLSSSTTDKE